VFDKARNTLSSKKYVVLSLAVAVFIAVLLVGPNGNNLLNSSMGAKGSPAEDCLTHSLSGPRNFHAYEYCTVVSAMSDR
jgi:hypothetical protein